MAALKQLSVLTCESCSAGYAEQQNAEILHPELFHLCANFGMTYLPRYSEETGLTSGH